MNDFRKAISVALTVLTVLSSVTFASSAEETSGTPHKITAGVTDVQIDVDGKTDAAWTLAEPVEFDTPVGTGDTEATVKALISKKWVSGTEYDDLTLYLLFEMNKHGTEVSDSDTVFIGIDLLRSGIQTGLITQFGVGLLSVCADGRIGGCHGWFDSYRKGDFVLKATKTAKDKWTAEMAIMLIGSDGSRSYTHNDQNGFGKGTEIGFSAFVRDESSVLPSGKSYKGIGLGITDKQGLLYPNSTVVVGDPVSSKATLISGDVNNDGKLNGRDATLLLKVLADWDINYTKENADADKNNLFNGKDATYMLKYLADWDLGISPYFNKTVFFFGDSICAASVDDGFGWAGRIGEGNGFLCYKNYGVNGASVSDCRNHTIYDQIEAATADQCFKPDLIVLHGGVNDAWDMADIGSVSGIPVSEYSSDDSVSDNFADALEFLFYAAREYYPKAKIVYIINFKLNSGIGSLGDMSGYFNVAKQVCDKWGVPYLDLYDNPALESSFSVYNNKFTSDGIHPSSYGYDALTPFIEPFVLDAFNEKADK